MGEQVDRYTLGERLGIGGMAEVYLATAEGPHGFRKHVAIKRILPRFSQSSSSFERRFIREARVAVGLTHPAIAQVIDFGSWQGQLYIVMEYVEGTDLRCILRNIDGAIPLSAILKIGLEVCDGLGYAHQRGVVHRDVSPANILISRHGAVKVADFGVATSKESGVSGAGEVVGKWRYMSPEQARGHGLDQRSDVFSFGAVLYELVTGAPLISSARVEEILDALSRCDFPDAKTLRPEIPADLSAVIRRCTQHAPDARFANCQEIATALRRVCRDLREVPSLSDVAPLVAAAREPRADDATWNQRLAGQLEALVPAVERKTYTEDATSTQTGAVVVLHRDGRDGTTSQAEEHASNVAEANAHQLAKRRRLRVALLMLAGLAVAFASWLTFEASRSRDMEKNSQTSAPKPPRPRLNPNEHVVAPIAVPERLHGTWLDTTGRRWLVLSSSDIRLHLEEASISLATERDASRLDYLAFHESQKQDLAFSFIKRDADRRYNIDLKLVGGQLVFQREVLPLATRKLQYLPDIVLTRRQE